MLVLSRTDGEEIVIGGDIVITVLQCAGRIVRLGITAPREVSICRQEVLEQLKRKKRQTSANERRGGAEMPAEYRQA
jgi:carbon storage regulator